MTTQITRDGKRIVLAIDRYQGDVALAFDGDGGAWLRKGRGTWVKAYLTVG